MSGSRPIAVVVAVAVLVGALTYLALTEGMDALRSSDVVTTTEVGHVPEFVHDPPDTVPTTADHGPVGPVSLVFTGSEIVTGLVGRRSDPWIAVSALDGSYRALSAPHLPAPRADAVAVAADGRRLAWGYDGGLVLYDPVRDEARVVGEELGRDPVMVGFSPDGGHLLVLDGDLGVVDIASGDVVASWTDVPGAAARAAVWTPDGEAVTYVADGRLVTRRWDDGSTTTVPTTIREGATLAWSPSGDRLAALRTLRGTRAVEVFDVGPGGELRRVSTVEYDGYAQQELLGFTGDARVTVMALTLETAGLPLVFNMSTEDAFPPTKVMQLPVRPELLSTLEVAGAPLAEGSLAFDEPDWPAGDLAKLTASVVLTVFLLGLYLTRRPRQKAAARPGASVREKVDA